MGLIPVQMYKSLLLRTNMKKIVLFCLLVLPAMAQVPPPPAASQTEVNAGTSKSKFVSPFTLAGWTTGGGETNSASFVLSVLDTTWAPTGSVATAIAAGMANGAYGLITGTNLIPAGATYNAGGAYNLHYILSPGKNYQVTFGGNDVSLGNPLGVPVSITGPGTFLFATSSPTLSAISLFGTINAPVTATIYVVASVPEATSATTAGTANSALYATPGGNIVAYSQTYTTNGGFNYGNSNILGAGWGSNSLNVVFGKTNGVWSNPNGTIIYYDIGDDYLAVSNSVGDQLYDNAGGVGNGEHDPTAVNSWEINTGTGTVGNFSWVTTNNTTTITTNNFLNATTSSNLYNNILNFGGVADGVTDITTNIYYALSFGKPVWFPNGQYVVSNLILSNNQSLLSQGAQLILNPAVTNWMIRYGANPIVGYTNSPASNIVVMGFEFSGSMTNVTTNGTRNGVWAEPFGQGNVLQNCVADGFSGIGFQFGSRTIPAENTGQSSANTARGVFSNCESRDNFWGFKVLGEISGEPSVLGFSGSDYLSLTGLKAHNNACGYYQSGGNIQTFGCHFDLNTNNIALYDYQNGGHSSIIGCSGNHGTGYGVVGTNISLGFNIIGCEFFYAPMYFTNCFGISVVNGTLSSGCSIAFDGGGVNVVRGNSCYGGIPTMVATNGGVAVFSDNYNIAGPVPVISGNGHGITNIPSTSITGGFTTNIQFTDTAFATVKTNTLYFTNGILMNVTSP